MYRTLLVPLDGSLFGERALPIALVLARMGGAKVVLVQAVWASARPGEDAIEVERQAIEHAEVYLAGVAQRLTGQGIQVETATPYAIAAEGILVEIAVRQADLVIMCTHGRSGLGRWLFGSVAEAVLAKSPVPVLLVRPIGPLTSLSLDPNRAAILVPLDGSAYGEASLPHAVAITRGRGGLIVLLRVVSPPVGYYPDPVLGQPYVSEVAEKLLKGEEQEAKNYLDMVAERLRAQGVRVQPTVHIGWPTDSILDEVRSVGADLIVMATHGRTGVGDLLLGSVALDVVRRSGLPLLLVRPDALQSQAQK